MAEATMYLPPTSQAYATALLGPAFMGWITHVLLCGVVVSHFTAYLSTQLYTKDTRATKLLLWSVFVLDVANMALNAEQIIHYGTDQHRDFFSVYIIRVIDSVPMMMTAVTGALLQSFLCRRASKLFNSNMTAQMIYIAAFHLLIAVALLAQVGEMVAATLLARDNAVDLRGFTLNVTGGVWLWVSSFIDMSLSLSLYLLLRRRLENNLRSVRSVVRVSFQTALLTSVFSLAGAVCGVAWPQENVQTVNIMLAFSYPLSSLYALSLVVTLASRTEQVVVVVGKTLAGYQESGLLDGLAGATAGQEVRVVGVGAGGKQGEKDEERALESDEEEEGEDDDREFEERDENDEAHWRAEEKAVDIEMGTEHVEHERDGASREHGSPRL